MPGDTSSSSTSTSSASHIPPAGGGIRAFRLSGLTGKIFLSTAFVVVVVLGGALWLTKQRADRAADESIERALEATRSAIDDALTGRSRALAKSVELVAQVPQYVARIGEGLRQSNRANLLDQAEEFRDQVGAAWALITDGEGVLRAKTNERDLEGEALAEGALVGIPLEGRAAEGVWIEPGAGGSDLIYQAVGAPIKAPQSSVVYGVLVAAVPVDSAFAAHLKANTNSEIAFFAFDTLGVPHRTVSTLSADAIAQALANGGRWDSAMADPSGVHLRWKVAGSTLVGVAGALRTASGVPVGAYAGLRSRDLELATFVQLRNTVFQAFIAGLALAIVSALVLARRVSRPVRQLVAATRQVAEGQYSGKIEVASRDEIGELAAAFQRMLRELKEKQDLVEYLSGSGAQTVALTASEQAQATAPGPGAQRAALTGVLEAGQVLANRYEVRKVLGAGGMGMVYRAWDRQLEEIVAVKTLKPEAIAQDSKSLERFKEEIRLARRITHRNVVRTHDLGEVNGLYYITMELVEGTNLKELIRKRGRLPVGVTLTVGKQLCRALEVAHEAGVIHRDIKPQNMVVDGSGFLKVMDFGIARRTEGHRMGEEGLTAVGTAIGTPEYMAPEQLLGEDLDPRVDLYAAGAVLFECVTGRNVFMAPNVMALMAKHLEEAPEDPQVINPEVPPSLSQLVLKALAKKRDQRWASAAELHQALERVTLEETVAA